MDELMLSTSSSGETANEEEFKIIFIESATSKSMFTALNSKSGVQNLRFPQHTRRQKVHFEILNKLIKCNGYDKVISNRNN